MLIQSVIMAIQIMLVLMILPFLSGFLSWKILRKIVVALLLIGQRKIEQSMEFDIDSPRAMSYTQNSEPISTKY